MSITETIASEYSTENALFSRTSEARASISWASKLASTSARSLESKVNLLEKYHSFICSPQREKCVVVIKPVVAELQTGVVFLFFCRRGGKKREKLHPVAFSDNGFITGTHF